MRQQRRSSMPIPSLVPKMKADIRHYLFDSSLQWILGWSVTECSLLHHRHQHCLFYKHEHLGPRCEWIPFHSCQVMKNILSIYSVFAQTLFVDRCCNDCEFRYLPESSLRVKNNDFGWLIWMANLDCGLFWQRIMLLSEVIQIKPILWQIRFVKGFGRG